MREYGPQPEKENRKALSTEFTDIVNPRAYLEVGKAGLQKFRELIEAVEE